MTQSKSRPQPDWLACVGLDELKQRCKEEAKILQDNVRDS